MMLPALAASAQVTLNEVMANNRSAVANQDAFPDYIELHNAGGQPADIGGWSLSDDPILPRRFVFPAGAVVPAGGFLVVWADTRTDLPGLHTGFGLGLDGDSVRLYPADSLNVVDQIEFGLQAADYPIGRIPDGSGAWQLTVATAGATNAPTAMGDASGLRFNEWMARPAVGEDWLELYNRDAAPVALAGLVITDSLAVPPQNRAIPAMSFIAPRGWVQLFASDLLESGANHLDFRLSADGETLTLYGADRTTVIERLVYGAQAPDTSQGRGPDGSDNIVPFPPGRATPGAGNFIPIVDVVISEILTHTDPPLEDAIELQNTTATPIDISGWWLSDSFSQPRKYQIPAGTVLAAGGFGVFYQYQFNAGPTPFSLSSVEGEQVVLSKSDPAGNLTGDQTSVSFGPLKNGVSIGRHVTSAGADIAVLSRRTFGVDNPSIVTEFRQGTGLSNAPPRSGPIVISELMIQPLDGSGLDNPDLEFIELHNPTALPAALFDPLYPTNAWRIRDGVSFDFPTGLTLPSGGFLVVVPFDPVIRPDLLAVFKGRFNVPDGTLVLGPFSGRLSDSGETIELREPDAPEGPGGSNPGLIPYAQVEFVRYGMDAPWPVASPGLSLQKRIPLGYANEPTNWVAALPSPGRAVELDTDNDGMPDSWEQTFGFDKDDAGDAALDADEDLATNLQEYLSGTDPRNAAEVLAFSAVAIHEGGIQMQFTAVGGRSYSIQRRDPAPGASWLSADQIPAVSTNRVVERVIPTGSAPALLFRIVTPATP